MFKRGNEPVRPVDPSEGSLWARRRNIQWPRAARAASSGGPQG
jgi:hypothetical protein